MNWFVQKFILCVACVLLLACATSAPPQRLVLDPTIKHVPPIVNQGITLNISVMDARHSEQIGVTSDILGEQQAIIVESAPLVHNMQTQSYNVLQSMGIAPVIRNIPKKLNIIISRIEYITEPNSFNVSVITELQTEAITPKGRYNGKYSAKINKKLEIAPSSQTNTDTLNTAVSEALTHVFKDTSMFLHLSS